MLFFYTVPTPTPPPDPILAQTPHPGLQVLLSLPSLCLCSYDKGGRVGMGACDPGCCIESSRLLLVACFSRGKIPRSVDLGEGLGRGSRSARSAGHGGRGRGPWAFGGLKPARTATADWLIQQQREWGAAERGPEGVWAAAHGARAEGAWAVHKSRGAWTRWGSGPRAGPDLRQSQRSVARGPQATER